MATTTQAGGNATAAAAFKAAGWRPSPITVAAVQRMWNALLADEWFCYGIVQPLSTSERRNTLQVLGMKGIACEQRGDFSGWSLSDNAVVAMAARCGITESLFEDDEPSTHPDDIRGEVARRKPALRIDKQLVAELAVTVAA